MTDAPLTAAVSPASRAEGPPASARPAPEPLETYAVGGKIPFESRLAGLLPIPPFATGMVIALFLGVTTVSIQAALGGLWAPHGSSTDALFARLDSGVRASVVLSLLLGYVVAASRAGRLGIVRDLIEMGLHPPLPADDPDAPLRYAPDVLRRSRWVGGVGAAFGMGVELVALAAVDPNAGAGPRIDDPGVWTTGVLTPLLGFFMARAAFSTIVGISPRRKEREPVDLLDLRRERIRGRIGVRLALFWILGSSIASLFFLDPDLGAPLAPLIGVGLAVGGLAFYLETRGSKAAIRDAKQRELARIAPELRIARESALRGDVQERGRLADLLVWRSYVESIREWPFDGTLLLRFGLYVLIPLGSWLGGALVERALSLILD